MNPAASRKQLRNRNFYILFYCYLGVVELDNGKGNKGRVSPLKVICLTLLAGALVIPALTFSTAENIKAFDSGNTPSAATAESYKAEVSTAPVSVSKVSPSVHIGQNTQPISNADPVSVDVSKNEVKTGEKQPLLSLEEINKQYEEFGRMTVAGMKPEDYDKAMAIEWETLDTPGEPQSLTVDISKLMNYKAFEKYIINLDKYEGVEVSVIGKSGRGRNIYMVKVDLGAGEEREGDKPIIMLTGNVHAREFAGAEYITKFLNDTIKKAAYDDYTRLLLESAVIVAVPLVNPDGREIIINGGSVSRKSNANGVDLNRAMPSLNAGQLANGVKMEKLFSTKPGMAYFAGYNLGTESETQAMIKWFNYYVPIADLYVDLHQQGGTEFYNKIFLSSESDALSKQYAVKNNILLKKGYRLVSEKSVYGLIGSGGTFTDYAKSVAEGCIYSYSLGRMVLDADGTEMPLISFRDIDLCKQYYKPLNSNFKSICIEIGRYRINRGASRAARRYREKEYNTYGWKNFLTGTIENVLGVSEMNILHQQAGINLE